MCPLAKPACADKPLDNTEIFYMFNDVFLIRHMTNLLLITLFYSMKTCLHNVSHCVVAVANEFFLIPVSQYYEYSFIY